MYDVHVFCVTYGCPDDPRWDAILGSAFRESPFMACVGGTTGGGGGDWDGGDWVGDWVTEEWAGGSSGAADVLS